MKYMKRLLIVAFGLIGLMAFAQENEAPLDDDRDPKGREKVKAIRIAYITEKLGLTPEQSEKFWPVYNEFFEKRQEMRKELRNERERMGTNALTPEQKQTLINLDLAIKQKELDLEKGYSTRLMRVITADQMLKLRTAEKDFQRMLIQQLQQKRAIQQRRENLRDRNQLQRQRRN